MDEACSKHGRGKRCIRIVVGIPKKKNHLEDLGVVGNIILE